MPVVAVVAGAAMAAGGMAGAAALMAGTVTLSTVAAGLAVVGGVTTALGAITGNKKLQKFGMIAGVGALGTGGIAALSNAGGTTASTGTGLAANAAGEGLQAAGIGAGEGLQAAGIGAGEVSGASFAGDIGARLGAVDTGVSAMATGGPGMAPANYALSAPAQSTVGAAGAASSAGATAAGPAVPQTGFAPSPGDAMGGAAQNLRVGGTGGVGDTGSGAFSNFSQWLNQNKELAKMGTGILSGVGQSYMADQNAQRQVNYLNDQRARFNASITGQSQRY